jgi:hypothetical protein
MSLTVIPGGSDQTSQNDPDVRGLSCRKPVCKKEKEFGARIEPVDRRIALNIGKIDEHSSKPFV